MKDYGAVLERVTTAIREAADGRRATAAAVGVLKREVPDYNWVGIYLLDGNELVLGPFVGKPSPHTRIPLGRGICGAAADRKDDDHRRRRERGPAVPGVQHRNTVGDRRADHARWRSPRRNRHRQRSPGGVRWRDQRLLEAVARASSPPRLKESR